jgi:hypothetical protein
VHEPFKAQNRFIDLVSLPAQFRENLGDIHFGKHIAKRRRIEDDMA